MMVQSIVAESRAAGKREFAKEALAIYNEQVQVGFRKWLEAQAGDETGA